MDLTAHERRMLRQILSQPTAPFREQRVAGTVCRILDGAGVPWCTDPVGNLLVGVGSQREYKALLRGASREPLRVLLAHMDHPGFHGVRWLANGRLAIRWHGGAPIRRLAGAPVWVADGRGFAAGGVLRNVVLSPAPRRRIRTAQVVLERGAARRERPAAYRLFGGFRFRAACWQSGKRIYTRAADDLGGTFVAVCAACRCLKPRAGARGRLVALLARAEEVGFVGTLGHLELGWLQRARRRVVIVNIETSRALPGAVMGRGPVVRLGDRGTVFEPGGLRLLAGLAARVLPGKHQRRVMDGGACEAGAALIYGVPAVAIALPLGNYHNQSIEGGPDARQPGGPAPEFLHLDDLGGAVRLCAALAERGLPWADCWKTDRKALHRRLAEYRRLLDRFPVDLPSIGER